MSQQGEQRGGSLVSIGSGEALVLVALGGAGGSLIRHGLGILWGDALVTTLVVNLAGAFLLGVLVTMLSRLGERSRGGPMGQSEIASSNRVGAERWRLLLGTGALGGFTTYSGLTVVTGELVLSGKVIEAMGYATLTLVAGLVSSLLGTWAGEFGRSADRSAR